MIMITTNNHPVHVKWVVDKRTGGNYGLIYPVKENRGKIK